MILHTTIGRIVSGAFFIFTVGLYIAFNLNWDTLRLQSQQSKDSVHFVQVQPSPSDHIQLLLVTHGRTGSTFTSNIISQSEDVFFVFEPLFTIRGRYKDIAKGTVKQSESIDREESIKTIEAFLTCDFREFDASVFKSFLLKGGTSTKKVYRCLNKENASSFEYIACFQDLWRSCVSHKATFVKTIRFELAWAETYLQRYPNMKILLLVRDVRAVMHSQASTIYKMDLATQAKDRSHDLCSQILSDVKLAQRLHALYSGRIKVVRYEDGCLDPIGYARAIYQFAGLEFTDTIRDHVYGITHSNETNMYGKYTVEKRDAIKAMNSWRRHATMDVVRQIDDSCHEVDDLIGYKTVTSEEELKSDEVSLVRKPLIDNITLIEHE